MRFRRDVTRPPSIIFSRGVCGLDLSGRFNEGIPLRTLIWHGGCHAFSERRFRHHSKPDLVGDTTMKTIITTAAAALFAANVGAVEIYDFLGQGNPDLSPQRVGADDFVGVQPSVGDSIDHYHGLADGNADLFKADRRPPTDSGERPDIHMSLGGNPDLRF
jgi:hypothetical protein